VAPMRMSDTYIALVLALIGLRAKRAAHHRLNAVLRD